ncbi:MAG: hypothetical protein L0170_00780, partial [Acidobacteria bacterium]|nr:hypothetical protein [Acidobacteriota bacterium]
MLQPRTTGKRIVLGLLASLAAVALLPEANAQRVRATGFKMNADSSTVFLAGVTSSGVGVEVPFQAITGPNETIRGYKYDKAALSSLKPGALIPLYIRNLKFSIEFGQGCTDETGEPLSGCNSEPPARGAWKTVTLESVELSADAASLKLIFAEDVILRGGAKLRTLEFVAEGDWFVPKPPPRPKA